MIDYNNVFIYSDQQTLCPYCSSNTEIILDLSHTTTKTQIHKCFRCYQEFIMQYDKEFEEYDNAVLDSDYKDLEIEIFL